jgi:hypothetical protein
MVLTMLTAVMSQMAANIRSPRPRYPDPRVWAARHRALDGDSAVCPSGRPIVTVPTHEAGESDGLAG